MKRLPLSLLVLLFAGCGGSQHEATPPLPPPPPAPPPAANAAPAEPVGTKPSLLPLPQQVSFGAGSFALGPKTRILVREQATDGEARAAEALSEVIGAALGSKLKAEPGAPADGTIHLVLDPQLTASEGYELVVRTDRVELR